MRHQHLATAALAAVIALNVVSGLACSRSNCPYGVYPFVGATNVSENTHVTFYPAVPVPRTLPEFDEAFTFVNDNNEAAVPFTLEIDDAGTAFTLIPHEPLLQGATYRVSGVDMTVYQAGGIWWEGGADFTTSIFTVGVGEAHALNVAYDEVFEEVVVAFSEPVNPEDWTVIAEVPSESDSTTSLVAMEPVGRWNEQEHVYAYVLTEGAARTTFADEFGIKVRRADSETSGHTNFSVDPYEYPEDVLAEQLSLAHCQDW